MCYLEMLSSLLSGSKREQINNLSQENTKLSRELTEEREKNQRMQDRLIELEKRISEVEGENKVLRDTRKSIVSSEKISSHVDNMLANPDINLTWVPDKIEKLAYEKSMQLSLLAFAAAVDHASFEIMGHKLRIVIEPIDQQAKLPY